MGYVRKLFGSGLKISIQDDYVLVDRPAGYEATLTRQLWMLEETARICDETRRYKVLIRGTDTHVNLSTMDILDLGNAIANTRLRIAVVEKHNAPGTDIEFLEDVIWNRGGRLHFFDDEDDAMEWLHQTRPAAAG